MGCLCLPHGCLWAGANEEEAERGLWGILLLRTGMILTPLPFTHGWPYHFTITYALPFTVCSLAPLGKKVDKPKAFLDTFPCFAASWGFCVALESSVLSTPNVQGFSGPVPHSCPDTEVSGNLCKACRWGGGIYTHRLVHTQSLDGLIFLLLWQNTWHSILGKEGFILATVWGIFLPSSGVMMKFSFFSFSFSFSSGLQPIKHYGSHLARVFWSQ